MRKRWSFFALSLGAWALAWLMAGCASTPAPAPDAEPSAEVLSLSPAGETQAEALALFSVGIMDEYERDLAGAMSNYERAAALDPDNEDLNLRIAVGLLQQRKTDDAIAIMEGLCRRRPDSEKALLWLALMYRAAQRVDKVEATYRRLIKVVPTKPAAYVELASLYLKQGQEKKALRLLETGADRVDDPTDLLEVLGAIYRQRALAKPTKEEKKNRDRAIRLLEQALDKEPDNVTLLFQLGELHIQNRNVAGALPCFERVETLLPDNLPLRERLAESFAAGGDGKDQAIEALEQEVVRQPGNARLYFYLGILYYANGNPGKAKLNLTLSAKAAPTDPAPFVKMALMEIDTDSDAAVATLEKGLRQIPGDYRLNEMIAYIHFANKKYAQAVEFFAAANRSITNLPPEKVNPGFFFNYAIAAQKAGLEDDAAQLLNRAMDRNPAYLDAYLQYAFQQREDGQRQVAINILEAVGRLQPDEPNVYLYLGLLNSYLKSYKAAIAAFEKTETLVEDSPQKEEILDSTFYFWYGAACEREGQFDRAEKLFAKCIELDPEHSEAYNYLAYMWAEKGVKLNTALEYVQKALKINPASGAFIDTLGWIYYMQGQYQDAKRQIDRAASLIPDDPTIADHLGDVLYKLGDEKQAIPHWEKSFVLDPGNEKVGAKLQEHGVDLEPLRKKAEAKKKAKADVESEERKNWIEEYSTEAESPLAPPAQTNAPPPAEPVPVPEINE